MKNTKHLLYLVILIITAKTGFAQQRKVLIEQFTNSGCPPCAANTPLIASYVNAHSDSVLMIAYHTSFPYQDSMYFENPVQSNNRVAFNNIVSVPRSVVDGNFYSGNSVSAATTNITVRANVLPKYQITFTSSTLNNAQVNLSVLFESININNTNDQLVGHVVLVEKNVLKSSYVCCAGANTENEYPWVMRKMLPDEFGTNLVNKQIGGVDSVSLNYTFNNDKDVTQLRAIAFVQNMVTKEIYQSEISDFTTLSTSIELPESGSNNFSFANPLNENTLQLQFTETAIEKSISIYDVKGIMVKSFISLNNKFENIDLSTLKNGLYLISVNTNGDSKVKKLVIQKNK
jgi:hypothetical protein